VFDRVYEKGVTIAFPLGFTISFGRPSATNPPPVSRKRNAEAFTPYALRNDFKIASIEYVATATTESAQP
jgi:hypothetical protein